MTDTEQIRATLTLCLLAAYADRQKHEREGEEIRRIAEGLAASEEINLPALYQDVLRGTYYFYVAFFELG